MAGEENRGRDSSTQPTIPPQNPPQGTILTKASTTDPQVSIKGTLASTSRQHSRSPQDHSRQANGSKLLLLPNFKEG